jgi:hypothetical protein
VGCAAERGAAAPAGPAPRLCPGPVAGASARGLRAAAEAVCRVGNVARRLWIVCLGDRRYRYGREPPRAAGEAMPLEEALDLASACLNPLGFLTGDWPMRAARRRWVAVACGVLLAGAGLGFVARDLLGLEQSAVAIALVVSVAAGLGRGNRGPEDADRRAS